MDGIGSIVSASALGRRVALSTLMPLMGHGGISARTVLLGQQMAGLVLNKMVRSGAAILPSGTLLLDEVTAIRGVTLSALVLLNPERVRAATLPFGLTVRPADRRGALCDQDATRALIAPVRRNDAPAKAPSN